MPPVFTSLILVALFLIVVFTIRVTVELEVMGQFSKPRGNSRQYVCLNKRLRKKGFRDLFSSATPNYQRMLERLPATVEELDVSDTDIEFLDRLPAGLKFLRAHNCPRLKRVASWPAGVVVIDFWTCPQLDQLPAQLPSGLIKLWLVGTAVRSLPRLPRTLQMLDARCCDHLQTLSEDWPEFKETPYATSGVLHWINLCRTPAMATVAGNLPAQVLELLRTQGAAGWKENRLFNRYDYADKRIVPPPGLRPYF